jgi:hypothetical protein
VMFPTCCCCQFPGPVQCVNGITCSPKAIVILKERWRNLLGKEGFSLSNWGNMLHVQRCLQDGYY